MSRTQLQRAKTSVEKPRANKPSRRYGTECDKSRDIFEFHGDSYGDTGSRIGRDSDPHKMSSSWGLSTGHTVALEEDILSSVRPSSKRSSGTRKMLPSAPKSIAQTLSSETSILDKEPEQTHLSNTPPELDKEAGNLDTATFGSGMLNPRFPSHGRHDAVLNADTTSVENPGNLHGLCEDNKILNSGGPSLSASVLSPSKIITVERRNQSEELFNVKGGLDDDESSAVVADHPTSKAITPVVLLPQNVHGYEGTDELSLPSHGPETWSINQTALSKTRKRKTPDSQLDEPSSDEEAIGLPKDQYQPRPSKSRSGRDTEKVIIPADFSKRPEAAGKKKIKRKRCKTTAFHELRAKIEEDDEDELLDYKPTMQKIDEIPMKTFEHTKKADSSEPPAERAVTRDSPPTSKQDAWSVEAKQPRGRPKTGIVEGTDGQVRRDVNENALDLGPEKGQDSAPAKKATKGAKRKEATLQISEEIVQDSDDELGDVDEMVRKTRSNLHETQDNGATSKPAQKPAPPPSPTRKATSAPPTKVMETPPQTPPKSGTTAQKGPDKHSPISSGKVAYRVGLSKRARIAPLLRIVRKA